MASKWGYMRGRYCVVIDVVKASNGWYPPRYEIFDGNPSDGAKLVKRQDFVAGPDFPNRDEASRQALAVAESWLAKHRSASGHEKAQSSTGPA
jgi:hypothetical protein